MASLPVVSMPAPQQGANLRLMQDPYEVLNTRDVARIMKCGVRKVQRMAASRQLPMKLFGCEYVITRHALQEYLDS